MFKKMIRVTVFFYIFVVIIVITAGGMSANHMISNTPTGSNGEISVVVAKGFTLPMASGKVTSLFGYRSLGDFHTGLDLSSSTNGNIYAIASGTVAYTVYDGCGGNTIVIYHNVDGKKYTSYYGHLLKMNVSAGDEVTNNTVIGIEGSTGTCTTGIHLHLEIYEGHLKKDYPHREGYQHLLNPINFFEGLKEGGYFERK